MAIDPVCMMSVDLKIAPLKTTYKQQIYYFRSPGCRITFEKDPEEYLEEAATEQENHPHGH